MKKGEATLEASTSRLALAEHRTWERASDCAHVPANLCTQADVTQHRTSANAIGHFRHGRAARTNWVCVRKQRSDHGQLLQADLRR